MTVKLEAAFMLTTVEVFGLNETLALLILSMILKISDLVMLKLIVNERILLFVYNLPTLNDNEGFKKNEEASYFTAVKRPLL